MSKCGIWWIEGLKKQAEDAEESDITEDEIIKLEPGIIEIK